MYGHLLYLMLTKAGKMIAPTNKSQKHYLFERTIPLITKFNCKNQAMVTGQTDLLVIVHADF